MFESTVTITGIFIGLFPVISFFSYEQMKKDETLSFSKLSKSAKPCEENFSKKIDAFLKTVDTFYHNLRVGLLRYTGSFVVISIALILTQIVLYLLIDSLWFIVVDVAILIVVLFGILPIVSVLTIPQEKDVEIELDPLKIIKIFENEEGPFNIH